MTLASRLFAGLAAFALVLTGLSALAPSKAQAQSETAGALLAVGIFAAVAVATFVLVDEEGDDEEPQSP